MNTSTPQPSLSPISIRDPSPQDRSRSKQKDTSQFDSSLEQSVDSDHKRLNLNLGRSSEVDRRTDDERSTIASPAYSEEWEEYSSPRKTTQRSQLTHRSTITSQMTHRSRESGRLSPAMQTASVEVGTQPLTLPRFNEPLKLRKGRHFVDFQEPAPTVVYVPNRSFAHGSWTNVAVERKNGRYVVIEQRPIHTQFTETTEAVRHEYKKDIFGPETSWTKKKAPWRWSTKGNFIERSVNRRFYEPYLPPMKERYSHVDSKVGSLDNYEHQPGGGAHRIPTFKLKWEAEAKIGSLPNTSRDNVSPQGSLKLPNISPRFGASAASGSFTSIHYTPGGNVILRKQKFDAKSQVGSLDNISHTPGGGDVHIPKNKIKWRNDSKVGSLDNVTHLPKSTNVQIFKEKLDWKTDAKIGSLDNAYHIPKKGHFRVPNFKQDWNKTAASRVDSLSNVSHTPRGGNVQVISQKLKWKAKPKIQSHWKFNYDYKSLFGDSDNEFDGHSFSHAGTV